jgi:hypothetical protein
MPLIDPNKNPVGLDTRLKGETNPAHRRMLEEVRFHVAVEAALDIDAAIARLAPNCQYLVYDTGKAPVTISGKQAIRRDFYDMIFDVMDGNLEWDIVLCAVDGRSVITEGQQKNAVKGSTLIKAGIEADPNTFYLQDARHLVIWPFDSELRLIGETVYLGCSTPLEEVAKRPLKPADIGTYSGPVIKPGA